MTDASPAAGGGPEETPPPARLGAFIRLLGRRAGRKGLVAVALQLGSTLSESASILLLVPVLGLVDRASGTPVVHLPDSGAIGAVTRGATVSLPAILALLVALVALSAFLTRWRSIHTTDLVFGLVNGVRMDLVRAMAEAGWSAFGRIRSADLTHVLTGDVERLETAASSILAIVQTAILIGVYAALCVVISPAMSLAALAAGVFFVLVLTPIRRRAHALGRSITEDRRAQYRIVADVVQGMKSVKLYGAETRITERFDETLERMRADAIRFRRFASLGTVVIQVANALGLALFVWGALVWAGLDLPRIVVMLLIFMRIAPRFLILQGMVQQVLQCLPVIDAVARAQALFDAEREPPIPAAPAPRLDHALAAEGIGFRYPGGGSALRDVSFTLRAGEALAVIGPSGGGKSTLADILLGLVAPDSGRLCIDGQEIGPATRRAWRSQVAFVPQDIVLMHDTILANLRLAAPEADAAAARHALEQAQAWDFVCRLPEGLETVVGDGGGRLSGGERQRIAIAQALLRQPRLLVLDEATSALDRENEAATVRALAALHGRTTLVTIAHRPSMIALADRVLVLDGGRVAEAGRVEALRARPDSRLSRMLAADAAFG